MDFVSVTYATETNKRNTPFNGGYDILKWSVNWRQFNTFL